MKDWELKDTLPLLGVVVGWLLTRLTTHRAERLADRRIIKEVLYFLLELHHLLTGLLAVEAHLPALAVLLRKQAAIQPPVEYEAQIDELLATVVRDSFLPLFTQQLAGLKESYTTSLLKLSAVDPLSAFELRGLDDILQIAPQLVEGMQAAGATHLDITTPPPASVLKFMRQHLEAPAIANTKETVQDVMQQLARQLDRRTRRRLAAELAQPGPSEAELAEKIDGLIQQAQDVLISVRG